MDQKLVRIEKVVFRGNGLSRDLEKVTFVPFTLPGEKVLIQINKEHHDYQEAHAVSIVEPSPHRIAPDCKYYGICGGCQLSHATYENQLQIKLQMLEDVLQRNNIAHPPITTQTGKPFGYRHRVQLKYDAVHKTLGFYEAASNRVVDIHECLCLTAGLNELLLELRSEFCSRSIPGVREILIYENDQQETAVFFHPQTPADLAAKFPPNTSLTVGFRGHRYPMNPEIFLQVNPGMWRALIQEVESHYPDKLRDAVELYSGAGFFTIPLSDKFERITACEDNPAAVQYARKAHRKPNVFWVCSKVEEFSFPRTFDALIVDPPRAGLPRTVLKRIAQLKPKWISYISCDCSTLARDLKKWNDVYTVQSITLLDLFPQTYHFETVLLLQLRS